MHNNSPSYLFRNPIAFVEEAFTDLTNKLYGLIAGVPVPFPLPQEDACKLGVTCPIVAGTQYVETVGLTIESVWPDVSF